MPEIGYDDALDITDDETIKAHEAAKGKIVQSIALVKNELTIRFTDGTGIVVWDDKQLCCERRYMTTGDDLDDFVNEEFRGFELREVTPLEYDSSVHEIQFLLGMTSFGVFTLETHNQHNGYYSGFNVVIREVAPSTPPPPTNPNQEE